LTKILGFEALNHVEDYTRYYNIKKGDVVVDAGAHVGVHTQTFSKAVGKDGLVIAIDPDFRAVGMLVHNTAHLQNVKILPYALWHEEDVLPFQYMSASGGVGIGSVVYQLPYWYPVRAVSLDQALKEIGVERVNFVKMDVEGSELRVLDGMAETLKYIDALAVAAYHRIDDDGTRSFKEVLSILESKGFVTRLEVGFDGEIVYANR
jgi:FkbM family methyltransferase